MKTETYILPVYWASYIINGDASSFSLHDDGDEELAFIDNFLGTIDGYCVNVGDESWFSWTNDSGNGLGGDVAEYTFIMN